eukprot:GFUD01029143.1.p1 GENE.GFUD01029143.1~~GFUD01029143.1.p1  ORF type:complete len:1040 (-),score=194.28 GFUD01029143.1:157-3276(-)
MLKNTSNFVINKLELFFYTWGKFVSVHPYKVILSCIILTALCSLGFLCFRAEFKANHLWIPPGSEFNLHQKWVDENFKKNTREESVLFMSDNVLTAESLRQMQQVHQAVADIQIIGKTYGDICFRVPTANILDRKRRKRHVSIGAWENSEDYYEDFYNEYLEDDELEETEERIDFMKYSEQINISEVGGVSKNAYCNIVTTLEEKCCQRSLLEIWRYSEDLIHSATQEEILDAVNLLARSPWLGHDVDYSRLLGGITRNTTGHIVGAKTAAMFWVVEVPDIEDVVASSITQTSGYEIEFADPTTLAWESELIKIALNSSSDQLKVMVNAARSLGDVSTEALFLDARLMIGGYLLMFCYTIVMLGNLNTVEVRVMLGAAGIVSIIMGLAIALGISFLLGYSYTPVHPVLPFICLGIGVDDMFVLAQCWSNMKKNPVNAGLSLPDQMGTALKHAGVSITITSLTDVCAFGIGAVTHIPALASFCVCTAIGLGGIYLLQVSWFVAWMSLDERRIAEGRDGLIPCLVHKNFKSSTSSQTSYGDIIFKKYTSLLSSIVFKCVVIVFSLGMLAFGICGSISIRQKSDLEQLLPSDSYLNQWLEVNNKFYNESGWTMYSGEIYTSEFDHWDLYKIERLSHELEKLASSQSYIRDVQSWWTKLKEYSTQNLNFSTWEDFANHNDFKQVLSDFLYSPHGLIYNSFFKFDGDLQCNHAAPRIKASKFKIEYLAFDGPEEHIAAKKKITDLIEESNIPGAFSHVQMYVVWETDQIIGFEMLKNLGMALACIFLITLLLLANMSICLMVLAMVIFTLVDIVGCLHFWGITVDMASYINIILAVGLCVDYTVHIGHAFLLSKGSSKEKAVEAVSQIGPAVFNGGFSTFLAMILLGASTYRAFVTVFKVFFLTVLFGLFHGLVLFPVLLSLVGPAAEIADQSLGSSSSSVSYSNQSSKSRKSSTSNDSGISNTSKPSCIYRQSSQYKASSTSKPCFNEDNSLDFQEHNKTFPVQSLARNEDYGNVSIQGPPFPTESHSSDLGSVKDICEDGLP